MNSVLDTAARLEREGVPFALVTVMRAVAPISARSGDKAVVTPDGIFRGWVGGGCAQRFVVKTVRTALADGKARQIRVVPEDQLNEQAADMEAFGSQCPSRGALELLVDPVVPRPQLAVLGDSPVAATLSALASRVGFEVTAAALDAEAASFPDAAAVLPAFDAAALKERLRPGAYVVVATQGKLDVIALKAALSLGAAQVSFVASARKAAALKADLLKEGLPAADVEAIVAPAGLSISARTPEEIALSVLAGLVALRRGGSVARPAPVPEHAAATSGGHRPAGA
jgi:xanthine dehydrogenase accessory factor